MNDSLKAFENIDAEWLQLILDAKNLGIDKEEIKVFLQKEFRESKAL
ncbi:anti-repressor SinI family protein [Cytobacillus purgationiresistens]|uniref:DNA-binding transcriptional MerR regulator n=1 Tax=Cytobacillus purgationiresistens TaxID=863449 RepID=A0ABU0ALE3_9BACI|nr:DNA-binding transcriptional MerR regulator [Cytobacillus purgationiresistens]